MLKIFIKIKPKIYLINVIYYRFGNQIDFTKDYDNQEYNFLKLFFCEIVLALKLQKLGGTFIIKCFDLMTFSNVKY